MKEIDNVTGGFKYFWKKLILYLLQIIKKFETLPTRLNFLRVRVWEFFLVQCDKPNHVCIINKNVGSNPIRVTSSIWTVQICKHGSLVKNDSFIYPSLTFFKIILLDQMTHLQELWGQICCKKNEWNWNLKFRCKEKMKITS